MKLVVSTCCLQCDIGRWKRWSVAMATVSVFSWRNVLKVRQIRVISWLNCKNLHNWRNGLPSFIYWRNIRRQGLFTKKIPKKSKKLQIPKNIKKIRKIPKNPHKIRKNFSIIKIRKNLSIIKIRKNLRIIKIRKNLRIIRIRKNLKI